MNPKPRTLAESVILLTIVYSLITQFIQLQFLADTEHSAFVYWSEWVIAVIFTVEYLARWIDSRDPLYPIRLMAIIDLLALLPFYLSVLVDFRVLRLIQILRVVRLFKLYRYSNAVHSISNAFHRVQYEFSVIGLAVLALAWFSAVAVFEFERRAQPNEFGKFSDAAWFVLTTLTTVGYGDRVPITLGGRLVTACTMIGGLGLFGTFVSLIGGAFVEELRHHRHRQRTADQQADAFDPQAVLDAIPGGMSQPEAIRLLEIACRRLVVEESESIAESSSL